MTDDLSALCERLEAHAGEHDNEAAGYRAHQDGMFWPHIHHHEGRAFDLRTAIAAIRTAQAAPDADEVEVVGRGICHFYDNLQGVCNDVDVARAALVALAPLRQAEREREWRPIGTAPRDGTSIMVWTAYGTITLAEWRGDQFYPWKGSDDEYAEHVITHWMPLPPPPTQEPHRATSSDAAREEGDRLKPGEPGDARTPAQS